MTNLNKNTLKLNTPKIDSVSVYIPTELCILIDERLTSLTSIYYHSLEAYEDEKKPAKPIILTHESITIRFEIINRIDGTFIKIVLTSKFIREKYFDGINKNNILEIYELLMSANIIHCTFKDFLKQSLVNDIDFCMDRKVNILETFTNAIESIYIQSGNKQKHLNPFREPTNKGLDFNKRNKATPSLPFNKLYHKGLELLHKESTNEFYNRYLIKDFPPSEIKNLVRVECTLKNRKHLNRCIKRGIFSEFTTLEELLEIPTKEMHNFIVFSIDSYIHTLPRKKVFGLSPSEHLMFELMQTLVLKGYDYEYIINLTKTFTGQNQNSSKVGKKRLKKLATKLFDLLIHKDLKIQSKANQNSHILEYLNWLGIKTQ